MKVKQPRHGQTLRRAISAPAVWLAGMSLLLTAAPDLAQAQSAGMAHLLHPRSQSAPANPPGNPPGNQAGNPPPQGGNRQPPRRADRAETERDMAERAGRQAPRGGNSRLSPDERKTLRKNLYDIGKEMYRGS